VPRKLLRIVGELLFTAGLIGLLYTFYSASFSNLLADQRASGIAEDFLTRLETRVETSAPKQEVADESAAEVIGLVYIPRLQQDVWGLPLNMGISERALALGLGHYSSTVFPGEDGNFALAGHRATNGEPLARFEKLQRGDSVFIQTLEGWFEYKLLADRKVQENETWVLDNQPAGVEISNQKIITLTTCDPRWNSYQRWVWWGELVASYPTDQPPIEVRADS
jgi:sortase A